MTYDFGLPERVIKELMRYFRAWPEISLAKIYGSRARGDYERGSDIDFAIWYDKGFPEEELPSAQRIWRDLYNLPTPFMFDVVIYENLTHEAMKKNIDRDAKVFYQKATAPQNS